jgi:hypothetical protein
MAVLRPGAVLYVSGEDRRETIVRRLQCIVGERGMDLTRAEQEHVFECFRVEDVSGQPVRLVADTFGVVSATGAVEQLIDAYRNAGVVVAVFDPLSLLGAGERSGNDGAAEMMRTARHISSELSCCCILVHHESKAGAREGIADQYAGRGGAAFADNSRGLLQLVSASALKVDYAGQKWSAPPHWTQDGVEAGNVLVLYLHKLTAAQRDRRPIFVRRNSWSYEAVHGMPVDSAEAYQAEFEGIRRAIVAVVDQGLKNQVKKLYSETSLAAACNGRRIASRAKLRDAVKELIADGTLLELPIPQASKLRQGSLKTYLVPASEVQFAL